MASRKEQKEALRREREEREQAAREAQERRRRIGYGAAGALVVAVAAVVIALVATGGDGGGREASAQVLPEGGEVPEQRINDLRRAAAAAGCQLRSRRADSREHTTDLSERVAYGFSPPAAGRHFQEPAADGPYSESPPKEALVHSLEHGRVVIWFKPTLARDARADLKALFDEDDYQLILTPNRDMPYAVAATAWNGEPAPNGTGRLLGCMRFDARVFDAIRAFRDEHRGNGPEPVP